MIDGKSVLIVWMTKIVCFLFSLVLKCAHDILIMLGYCLWTSLWVVGGKIVIGFCGFLGRCATCMCGGTTWLLVYK